MDPSSLHGGSLVTLVVSLVGMVSIDWTGLDTRARIAFSALTGLAFVILMRIALAYRAVSRRAVGWQDHYINHRYFTDISLWEGSVILAALNLPIPQVTVPSSLPPFS